MSCRLEVENPRPPLKNSALAPYLRDVVRCLVKTFEKPLADQGFELSTPKIKTYRKSISTPCGKYGEGAAPAYYCSATETIYWPESSDDGDEAYTFARLGYVGLTAHEFGHHLQAVTGMLTNYGIDYYGETSKKKHYEMSRRLELQAQCFEGIFLTTVRKSIDLDDGDRDELYTWHGFTGDEDPPSSRKPDHGSSKAQRAWLDRGLDSGDFGDCNTWTASRKSVE